MKMKTPCQATGGFTEKTLLVKNLLVLSFHYPINILHGYENHAVWRQISGLQLDFQKIRRFFGACFKRPKPC
jgi:hypothetical protein